MTGGRGWLGLALLLGGCTPAVDPRVRDFNADGLYLFQRGDYRDARDSFQAALKITPDDVALRYNVAQCQDRLGQLADAEKSYAECLRKDAGHTEARYALARLLVRQGRRDEAVQMTDQWLTSQPDRAPPYALDGWLWHQIGDLPRAQSRLHQALRHDPDDVRALNELGLIFEELHYPDRALFLYEHSLEVDPKQPELVERVNRLKGQGAKHPRPG